MNSSAVSFFCRTILKNVATSVLYTGSLAYFAYFFGIVGEIGYSWDFFAEGLRVGAGKSGIYFSLFYLPVKELPRLVLLAEIILVLLSSSKLVFFAGIILGSMLSLGSSSFSLKDFFLVC